MNGLSIAAYDRADKSNTVIQGVAVSTGPFPTCGTVPAAVGGVSPGLANINVSARALTITGFTIQSPAVTAPGEYTCGVILDGRGHNIYQNAFKVSCGDPGSVAIQTWGNANGPIGGIDNLHIIANSFSSSKLDTNDLCLGYEAIFINPQSAPESLHPVQIISNTFSGKMYRGVGVYDRDWTDIKYNSFKTKLSMVDTANYGTVPIGIKVWVGENSVVLGNEIRSKKRHGRFATGIWLNGGTNDNVVAENVVKGSEILDCLDGSIGGGTAGTDNLWQDNKGKKDSPVGICSKKKDDDDDDDD